MVKGGRGACTGVGVGWGRALVYRPSAEVGMARGALVAFFEKDAAPAETFHLYYANRAQMPGKLRAFIDFFQARNRQATE